MPSADQGVFSGLQPSVPRRAEYAVLDLARIVVPDYHPVISDLTIILAMLFLPKGLMRSFGSRARTA
ncbi:hypothetical protein [Mesorhizobium cantuariense]|uniref:Uncharacterized protein n=1 Tax=Mesorhizobium cantuariense TaxID=1300275 RepID=A0ABV7MT54_9HYPH